MAHSSLQAHFEAGGNLCAYVGEWAQIGRHATAHRICGRRQGQTGDHSHSQTDIHLYHQLTHMPHSLPQVA